MDYRLEICANSATSCIEAQKGGAYRVELCAGIPEGGTTPSCGEMMTARELLDIKLHVIIRPRGGDFLYSDTEMQTMIHDIAVARSIKVDGIVIGCLTADGKVDMTRNKALIEAAGDMSVTFHRAFDMTANPQQALEDIIQLGCDRVLTSGQRPTAMQGASLLADLVKQADNRIIVMPGCGVNEQNILQLAQQTGATEFHLSARRAVESGMVFRNPHVSMGGTNITINEYAQDITSAQRVADTLRRLQEIDNK